MHPYKEGEVKLDDKNVQYIVKNKEGFYEYEGSIDANSPLETKISYMKYFEAWDWIIVNGSWEKNFYELGVLSGNINQLATSSEELNTTSLSTSKIAKEVKAAVDDINNDLGNHDKNLESISGLMEELAASYQEVSASTDEVNRKAY